MDLDVDRPWNEFTWLTQKGERLEERQRVLERDRVAVGRRIYEMETEDEYQELGQVIRHVTVTGEANVQVKSPCGDIENWFNDSRVFVKIKYFQWDRSIFDF